MITIIDYKAGNFKSIANMLKRLGVESCFTDDVETIKNAEKLILPGVGHFDFGMNNLKKSGLIPVLESKVLQDKIPILGICLGAQLMTKNSEEGDVEGLGWVDAKTIKFTIDNLPKGYKVPHMGWTDVVANKDSKLTENLPDAPRYYFVHSYYMECENSEDVLFKSEYGHAFDAAFQHNNIYGVQFHPEKSHKFGMQLLKNFAEL